MNIISKKKTSICGAALIVATMPLAAYAQDQHAEQASSAEVEAAAQPAAEAPAAPEVAPAEATAETDTRMSASSDQASIAATAKAAGEFSTLLTAVEAAGMSEALATQGPMTVFAPTDTAFSALPEGSVDTLIAIENRDKLAAVLTTHIVQGKVTSADLAALIEEGNGEASIKTVAGSTLKARMNGDAIELTDEKGSVVTVASADIDASNGIIHAIDGVLMPATT